MALMLSFLVVMLMAAPLMFVIRGPIRRRRIPRLKIPPVEETAASVRRFREAVARYEMVEFTWDHFSQGRELLAAEYKPTSNPQTTAGPAFHQPKKQ